MSVTNCNCSTVPGSSASGSKSEAYAKTKQRSQLMIDNMNSQFAAIAAMAQHMDDDFRNTELVSSLHLYLYVQSSLTF